MKLFKMAETSLAETSSFDEKKGTPWYFLGKSETLIVCIFAGIETILRLVWILRGAIPAGHDGFQRFYLQNYFMANLAASGEHAEWIPHLTQGTVSSWWSAILGSPFLALVNFVAPMFKGGDFLWLFWVANGFDRVVFFVGMGLLLKRWGISTFASWLTAAALAGSISDIIQPWHNFRMFFLLPWCFLLLHEFYLSGRWRHVAVAAWFAAFQIFCGLPYFALPVSFIMFCYYFCLVVADPKSALTRMVTPFRRPIHGISAIAAASIPFSAYGVIISAGTSEIANYNPGRATDGTVSLETFLSYASIPRHINWLELVTGISPCVDYTLFITALGAPILAVGLFCGRFSRESMGRAILLFILVIYSFSNSGIVAVASYYVWPGMKFMRHLSLLAPFLKIPAAYFIAVGLDRLIANKNKKPLLTSIFLGTAAIAAALVFWSGFSAGGVSFWLGILGNEGKVGYHRMFNETFVRHIALVNLVILSFSLAAMLAGISQKKKGILCAALLVVAILPSSYVYRWIIDNNGLTPLPDNLRTLVQLKAPRFNWQRQEKFPDSLLHIDNTSSEPRLWPKESRYWSEAVFWQVEEAGSRFRIDHWMKSLDNLWKAYSTTSEGEPPAGFIPYRGLIIPSDPGLLIISGVNSPKLKLYTQWRFLDEYFLSGQLFWEDLNDKLLMPVRTGKTIQDSYSEIKASSQAGQIKVANFGANFLSLDVSSTLPSYLFYSDCYHSGWKATVNGQPVNVEKAFLAYKAVEIPKGTSHVEFKFRMPGFQFAQWVMQGAGCLVLVLGLISTFAWHPLFVRLLRIYWR